MKPLDGTINLDGRAMPGGYVPPSASLNPPQDTNWQADSLRRLVLADRKTVRLDRAVLLQILAQRDTPDQVVADIVGMFTDTAE